MYIRDHLSTRVTYKALHVARCRTGEFKVLELLDFVHKLLPNRSCRSFRPCTELRKNKTKSNSETDESTYKKRNAEQVEE